MPLSTQAPFKESFYRQLPGIFWRVVTPSPVSTPNIVIFNRDLASLYGFASDWAENEFAGQILTGSRAPTGMENISLNYGGHQFGSWNPHLGDGRAMIIGEVEDAAAVRYDIHLKGSGPTPFTIRGDGRAALGPMLREFLVSEAMAALGIPTTRSLAVTATGEFVSRRTLEPGAVLTRVARTHIRFGTIQLAAAYDAQTKHFFALETLMRQCLYRYEPDFVHEPCPPLGFFERLVNKQAELVAQWMNFGFIHGVMNTDNMSILGETLDYGPCAFMDEFKADQTYSAIDTSGRYAYNRQPAIALWNLSRLAEALLPLFSKNSQSALELANNALLNFTPTYQAAAHRGLCAKLGLKEQDQKTEGILSSFEQLMNRTAPDFTLFFRRLTQIAQGASESGFFALFETADQKSLAQEFLKQWKSVRGEDSSTEFNTMSNTMAAVNPIFIPRNHRLEQAFVAAQAGDMSKFWRLHEVLRRPFCEQSDVRDLELAPRPDEKIQKTFCGT